MMKDEAFERYAKEHGGEAWLKRHAFRAGWLAGLEQAEENNQELDEALEALVRLLKRTNRA